MLEGGLPINCVQCGSPRASEASRVEVSGIEPESESVYESASTTRSPDYNLREGARNRDETVPIRSQWLSETAGRLYAELTEDSARSRAVSAGRERTSR